MKDSKIKAGVILLLILSLLSWRVFKNFNFLKLGSKNIVMLTDTVDPEFKPGQVWSYKTRPGEENSLLTVVKVDSSPKIGVIISVYVDGLKVKNPSLPTGFNGEISHMPFTKKAMEESVVKLVRMTDSLPKWEEGYAEWKDAFENKDAGVFTIQVSKGVEYIETTLNKGKVVEHL